MFFYFIFRYLVLTSPHIHAFITRDFLLSLSSTFSLSVFISWCMNNGTIHVPMYVLYVCACARVCVSVWKMEFHENRFSVLTIHFLYYSMFQCKCHHTMWSVWYFMFSFCFFNKCIFPQNLNLDFFSSLKFYAFVVFVDGFEYEHEHWARSSSSSNYCHYFYDYVIND